MGNKICCEEIPQKQNIIDANIHIDKKSEHENHVSYLTKIQQNIDLYKPFPENMNKPYPLKNFGQLTYSGEVDGVGRPCGFGKMLFQKGSLYIGEFKQGKASGLGHYFWPDGSYFYGKMTGNKANDQLGVYICNEFSYKGQIKDNQFQGYATQSGNNYQFIGTFHQGKRKHGKITWTQNLQKSDVKTDYHKNNHQNNETHEPINQIIYEGNFDPEGLFSGTGKLQSSKGVYIGQFKDGKKHGNGAFIYKNNSKYEGTYVNGVKDGHGTIYSQKGQIAYCGEIKNGLPHGKGYVRNQQGNPNHLNWNQGICTQLIDIQNVDKSALVGHKTQQ